MKNQQFRDVDPLYDLASVRSCDHGRSLELYSQVDVSGARILRILRRCMEDAIHEH